MDKEILKQLLDKDESGKIKDFLIRCIEREMEECFEKNYIFSSSDLREILKDIIEEICEEEKEKIKEIIRNRVLEELKQEFKEE